MREKHVDVDGNTIEFDFMGKSGVRHHIDVTSSRVDKTIRECIELPGYELFQYLGDGGERHTVDSRDVNEYLQQITGEDLSAKDFRTWSGTTLAGHTLYELDTAEPKTEVKQALSQTVTTVAEQLGNTPTVCKTYYIHPTIVSSYEQNLLVPHFKKMYQKESQVPGLTVDPEKLATSDS